MTDTLTKIRELIQPLFDEEYYHLVDIELRGSGGNQVLKIYADTEQGITLREITHLTRQISDILEVHDVVEGGYRLEVSSPGINHSLQKTWEFRKNIGRELWVSYTAESGKPEEVNGRLLQVDEEKLVLQEKKKQITIPRTQIIRARVRLKW